MPGTLDQAQRERERVREGERVVLPTIRKLLIWVTINCFRSAINIATKDLITTKGTGRAVGCDLTEHTLLLPIAPKGLDVRIITHFFSSFLARLYVCSRNLLFSPLLATDCGNGNTD